MSSALTGDRSIGLRLAACHAARATRQPVEVAKRYGFIRARFSRAVSTCRSIAAPLPDWPAARLEARPSPLRR